MALTETQIQELYKFTRAHFVEHYDLQSELVDHLANGIETQWKEHPKLSFNEARLNEFRKFGITGFEKVVRKRKRAMEKRYLKIVLRFYGAYFKMPKVVLSILMVIVLTTFLFLVPLTYRYDIILGLLFTISAVVLFIAFRNMNMNDFKCVALGKKWMLKDQIFGYGQYASVFNLFPLTLNAPYFREMIPIDSFYVILGFSTLIISLFLLAYVAINIIPKKAEELLAETYPEYKMVS